MAARPRFEAPGPAGAAAHAASSAWGPILLLIAAVALAYSNSFQGEFVFDDIASIPRNPEIRSLWPPWPAMFPEVQGGRTVEGRPLVGLSLAVNYAISLLDVWSYHAFNLAVHLLATLTLFGVTRRTLLLPRLTLSFGRSATWLAFAVALLWGVHPLQTESVTYIVQRAESMVGLCYLLVLYCLVRGEQSPAARRTWFALAVVACGAGMATKEVMVTAPLVAMFYARCFVFDSWRETLVRRWPLWLGLAATWLLLAALVAGTGNRGGSVSLDRGMTSWQYLLTQSVAIVQYLRLSFSPSPLVFDYGDQLITDWALIAPSTVVVLALLAATLWALYRWPPLGFLGAAFFLILAPSSSVLPIVTQTLAEHRMYLPLATVVALVVVAFDRLWRTFVVNSAVGRASGRAPAAILLIAAFLLGTQTWLRNLDYRSGITLWEDTVDKHPFHPGAHINLGRAYLAAGDAAAAIAQCTRGIELVPDDYKLHYNRGTMYFRLGQYQPAIDDLTRALELKPDLAEALHNRGVARQRLGRHEAAIDDFTRALTLAPHGRLSYKNRALSYHALGQAAEARADVERFQQLGGTSDEELRKVLEVDR